MADRDSHHRLPYARPFDAARVTLVGALFVVTLLVTGRFAQAQNGKPPVGYAQSELRRAHQDNPREIRSRSYATDELGRAIVTSERSVPLHHTSNGQPIEYDPSSTGGYFFGFDGRPLDDPFRMGEARSSAADAAYYGSNGQAIELESTEAGMTGVYGSNGSPIDPTMLNGMSIHGAPSSMLLAVGPADEGVESNVLGGGIFRRDLVRHRRPSIMGTDQQEDGSYSFAARRPLLSLIEDDDAETADDVSLSPLLPLVSYDEDEEWLGSYDADVQPSVYSKNVPASYEQVAPERPSFGAQRYSAIRRSPFSRGDNSNGDSNVHRWPGRSLPKPATRSDRKPAYRSSPTLGRSLSSR